MNDRILKTFSFNINLFSEVDTQMKIGELFNGVQHIGLPTKCYDDTVAFYEHLGFSLIYSTLNNGSRVGFLKQGNLVIETYESEKTAGKAGAWDHVALECSDIDAAYSIISSEGYEIISGGVQFLPFFENGVKYFTFLGPNGESVEFNQKL